MKNFIIAALAVIAVASLVGNGLLYQRYSTNRPLVRIGSDVITKKQYQDAVDFQTQGAILKTMVYADLIKQAAAKAGLTPTEKDVDARIADIQRLRPELLADAARNPAKMAEMRDNIKTDIALESLRIQKISVTDAEVADFYNKNKQAFALPSQVQATIVVAENAVDASTASDLLKQNTPLDVIAQQPRLHVAGMGGFQPDFRSLPPAVSRGITQQVIGMKPGAVKTIPLGQQFLIIKANKGAAAEIPTLSEIKDKVTRLAKIQKAPTAAQEIARLYHDADVRFEVDRYSAFFADVHDAATVDTDKKNAGLPKK